MSLALTPADPIEFIVARFRATWTAIVEFNRYMVPVEPSPENGLRQPSFVTVDKAVSIRAEKLGPPFGRLAADDMTRVNRALALFLGIAG